MMKGLALKLSINLSPNLQRNCGCCCCCCLLMLLHCQIWLQMFVFLRSLCIMVTHQIIKSATSNKLPATGNSCWCCHCCCHQLLCITANWVLGCTFWLALSGSERELRQLIMQHSCSCICDCWCCCPPVGGAKGAKHTRQFCGKSSHHTHTQRRLDSPVCDGSKRCSSSGSRWRRRRACCCCYLCAKPDLLHDYVWKIRLGAMNLPFVSRCRQSECFVATSVRLCVYMCESLIFVYLNNRHLYSSIWGNGS